MELSATGEAQLRRVFKGFNQFMVLLWRLGLARWGNGTRVGGSVMVIKHTGRKSGLARLTPVNYAQMKGDLYCTAAFGRKADWYRNIQAEPRVEVWLPDGRWQGVAEDATGSADGASLLRQVIVASGFAGPLFGVNPKHMLDEDFEKLLEQYRLVRIRRTEAMMGPGGPGDLDWIWPLSTIVLTYLWLGGRRQARRRGR
jgi:deazaflavin-dependent oxidoreductase (nitroreductase family)